MENFEYLPNNGGNQTPTDKSSVQISNETPATNVGVLPINDTIDPPTKKSKDIPTVSSVPTTIAGNVSSIALSGNNPKDYKSNDFTIPSYSSNNGAFGGSTNNNITPDQLESYGLNQAGAFTGGNISGANSETVVDVDKYKKYIRGSQVVTGSIDDLNRRRAEDQSAFAQAGNATLRVVANVLPEIGQQIGGLFTNWTEAEGEFANGFVESMANIKQGTNEALPIYRQNPAKTFDVTDTAWWFDNGSNVVTSGLAFAAIGYATGGVLSAGLSAAARGTIGAVNAGRVAMGADAVLQATTLAPKTMNIINGLSTLGNSILLNQMETTGIQGQTWKEAYDKELQRLQRLPENFSVDDKVLENRAKRVASEASVTAGLINRINILTNLTSLSRLGNPNLMTTRRLLTEPTIKKSLGRYAFEMGQEALEETINAVAQDIAVNKLNTTSDILGSAMKAETLEQAFFGAFGGGFQTGITSIINRVPLQKNKAYNDAFVSKMTELQKANPNISQEELNIKATEHAISVAGRKTISRKNLEKQEYENQQRAIEDIKNRLAPDQVKELSTLFATSDERRELYNEIDKLEKAGNTQAANVLKEKNIISTIIQSFENGTAGQLESSINAILEMSQEDAVKYGIASNTEDVSYKTKIQESLEDLKSLEKAYNRSYGLLDMGEIFNTEVRLHELNKILNREDNNLQGVFDSTFEGGFDKAFSKYLSTREIPTLDTFVGEDNLTENTRPVFEDFLGRVNVHNARTSNIVDEINNLKDYLATLKSKEYQNNLRKAINTNIEEKDLEEGRDTSIVNNENEEELSNSLPNTDIENDDKDEEVSNTNTSSNLPDSLEVELTEEELNSIYSKSIDESKSKLSNTLVDSLKTLQDLGIDEDIYNYVATQFDSDNIVQTRNLLKDLSTKESDKELKDIYTKAYKEVLKHIQLLEKAKKLDKNALEVEIIENEAIKEILDGLVTSLPSNNIRFHTTGYTDLDGNYVDLVPLNKATNQTNLVENLIAGIKSKPFEDVVSSGLKQIHTFLFSEDVNDAIKNDATDNVTDLIDARNVINLLIKDYQTYLDSNKAALYNKDLAKQRTSELKKKTINEILNTKEEELEALKEYQIKSDEEFLQILNTRLQDRLTEIEQTDATDEEKQVAIQEAQKLHQEALDDRAKQQKGEEDTIIRNYDVQLEEIKTDLDVESENFVPFANLYESLPLESKQLIEDSRDNINAIFRKLEERGIDTNDYNSLVGAIQAIVGQEITAETLDLITFFYNENTNENITRPIINGLDKKFYSYIKDLLTNITEATDNAEIWSDKDNYEIPSFIGKTQDNLNNLELAVDDTKTRAVEALRLGYLGKEYTKVENDNGGYEYIDTGETRVDENDIRLLSNTNTFKEGDILELRILSKDEYLSERGDDTAIEYNEDVNEVPIGIFVKGEKVKGAYLHTLNWVNPYNIVNKNVNLEIQKGLISNLRQSVKDKGIVTVKINTVTDGVLNLSNEYKPINEITNDLPIAIIRNGKLFDNLSNSLNIPILNYKNGTTGLVVPMGNNSIFLPSMKTALTPDMNNSIYHIVNTFLFQDDSLESDKNLKLELTKLGLDFNSFASLRRFLNPIINVNTARHLNSDQYKIKYLTNKADKISTIKISNNSIEFTYNGEYYFLSRQVAQDNPLVVRNILENQFRDMLTTVYNNADINSLGKTIQFPIIGSKGTIIGEINDYNEYLKSILMSNLNPVTLPNGEVIYNIQKSFLFEEEGSIPLDTYVTENNSSKNDNESRTNEEIDSLGTDIFGNEKDDARGLDDSTLDDFNFDLSPEVFDIDNDIKEVYNSNDQLSKIGSLEEYNEYVETIFPDSKLKTIVYHGSKTNFDNFDNASYYNKLADNPLLTKEESDSLKDMSNSSAYYFTNNKNLAGTYGSIISKVKLNIENIKEVEGNESNWDSIVDIESSEILGETFTNSTRGFESSFKREYPDLNNKGIIFYDIYDQGSGEAFAFLSDVSLVYEPNQIHYLGSSVDVRDFKQFMDTKSVNNIKTNSTIDSSIPDGLILDIITSPENTTSLITKDLINKGIINRICD